MSFETRLVQLSADEYFADPCSTPSLSASIAGVLESQSPLHAWSRHPRFGGISRAPTKSLDGGALSHTLLLDAGKGVEIIKANDFRTNAAKEARDAARDAGRIPVLEKDYEAADAVASILRQRFLDLGITLDGDREITALWTETASNGAQVQCRGMLDHLKRPRIIDIKSIRSANPNVCRRHVETYGYAIQRAAYVSAIEKIHPEFAGRVDFVFVFFELEPPYAVTPVRLNGAFRELGERAWSRAVDRWEECLRTNHWPAYVTDIIELEPSEWALSKDMNKQISATIEADLEEVA